MSQSLFALLGGADGVRRIVDDTMAAHLANPAIKVRFENIPDIERAKKMAREFFTAGSGGPGGYSGKDMLSAHRGMNISEQEFLAAVDDILGALTKNQVSEEASRDVLAILYSLKQHIVRV